MTHRPPIALLTLICAFLGGWLHAPAAAVPPKEPTPIMRFDDVRIGMKGYGLTVFHGTKIQPFPVQVVSIVPNDAAQRGTIWIICDDPRLEVSGPVQGMSGSPIFLWEQGEEGDIGQGGKLIGAFAFGYAQVKICLAGVQPIEYMRDVAKRAGRVELDAKPHAAKPARPAKGQALATLAQLERIADAAKLGEADRFRLDMASRFARRLEGSHAPSTASLIPDDPGLGGEPIRLSLPMAVGTAMTAGTIAPLFGGTGILPVAGVSPIAGKPPASIDEDVQLTPGGVMSVPLVFGDADLSASGTVTDVLPDGTVIGFGHPMFGEGSAGVPMATGYVHFIVPRSSISFKRAGTLKLVGSLVRDEAAAVAGVSGLNYTTLPMKVTVKHPMLEPQAYNYDVVNHERLLPALIGTAFTMSTNAIHNPAGKSTMRVTGEIVFNNNRRIPVNSAAVSSLAQAALVDVVPALVMATQNQIEPLTVTSLTLDLTVKDGLELLVIESASTPKAHFKPGDQVDILVKLREYEGDVVEKSVSLRLPQNIAPGQYQIAVGGPNTYAGRLQGSRPYLFDATTGDDVLNVIERMLAIDKQAMYTVLQLNEQSLAVGKQNLAGLPSSRAALLTPALGGSALQFNPMIDVVTSMPGLIQGEVAVPINVIDENAQP